MIKISRFNLDILILIFRLFARQPCASHRLYISGFHYRRAIDCRVSDFVKGARITAFSGFWVHQNTDFTGNPLVPMVGDMSEIHSFYLTLLCSRRSLWLCHNREKAPHGFLRLEHIGGGDDEDMGPQGTQSFGALNS